MKAVISSTLDDKYLFFLPIVNFAWNKLGVEVICFLPKRGYKEVPDGLVVMNDPRIELINKYAPNITIPLFDCPEHKEATYSQVARLYAACLDLPDEEVLVTSDIDMAVFKRFPDPSHTGFIDVYGSDLVPEGQLPMCYLLGNVRTWRSLLELEGKTHQQMFDELLMDVSSASMRSDYWSKDQEVAFNKLSERVFEHPRANPGTQFATRRIDRDDSYWADRLNEDVIDAHLWRPGYDEGCFQNIITLLSHFYPNENFEWLTNYRTEYLTLIK